MAQAFDEDVDVVVQIGFGWAALDSAVEWTDVTQYCRGFTTDRGRSWPLDATQAGTATVVLDNNDFRFDPNNAGGPYAGEVKVMVPLRIRATYDSTTYDLYRGYVQAWPQGSQMSGGDRTVTLPVVDGFHLLAMLDRRADTGGFYSEELSGERIRRILDDVAWPAGWRDIDDGAHMVAGMPGANSDGKRFFYNALDEIRRCELVEQGFFYIGPTGNATFLDGNTKIVDKTGIQATFSDANFSNGPIWDVEPSQDAGQLWSVVEVTRSGGSTQSVNDSSSKDDYGPRSLVISDTLHIADGEANALAEFLLLQYKDPHLRVPYVVFRPQGAPLKLWVDALSLDFLDQVKIKYARTGAGDFEQDFHVEGIRHSVSMIGTRLWETTFRLSPDDPFGDWWIVGSSELDDDTRLYY